MNFDEHTITFIKREKTGVWPSGAPKYSSTTVTVIGAMQFSSGKITDAFGGNDLIYDAMFFTTDSNIADAKQVTFDSVDYDVKFNNPIYKRGLVHHYEVGLKKIE